MTAADPAERFMSPDEFRQVLKAMIGLPVWAARMKTYELYIGRKHSVKLTSLAALIKSENVKEQEFPDLNLWLGHEWTIVKHGRVISQDDGKPFATIWDWMTRKLPDIGTLANTLILDVSIDSDLSLCLSFADGQRLLTDRSWNLASLLSRTLYMPAADGRIKLNEAYESQDFDDYLRSLITD